jgi:hypothetical protein
VTVDPLSTVPGFIDLVRCEMVKKFSVIVVLPASTWAKIPTLRRSLRGVWVERVENEEDEASDRQRVRGEWDVERSRRSIVTSGIGRGGGCVLCAVGWRER